MNLVCYKDAEVKDEVSKYIWRYINMTIIPTARQVKAEDFEDDRNSVQCRVMEAR